MDPVIVLITGGALALVLLLVGIGVSISSDRKTLEMERIGKYTETDKKRHEENNDAKGALTDWINSRVERSSYGDQISKELSRADIKLKSGEYILLMIVAAFGVGVLLWFIGGRSIIVGIVGAIIGLYLPRVYVKREQGQRLIKFDSQLPDMLNLMVNGLRAGFSTMQAMEAVSRELPPPICDEFHRVVQEMQLGIPMEKALANLLDRIPSPDLDLTITAINVQREVGGNLAEILDTISYTIRERIRVKGDVRVLTTQVMYSGKFLSILPILVIGVLYVMNREYMMEFFKPDAGPCGIIALAVAGLLIIIGYFVMTKLGDIDI